MKDNGISEGSPPSNATLTFLRQTAGREKGRKVSSSIGVWHSGAAA
jgi:hypothetical protein